MSYELFKQGPEVYGPIILLSLAITVLAYGAFPLIFAIIRNSPITKKKYRGLCYGINIAVMVLFIIINGEASSGAPFVLWTWAFSSWGIRILEGKGLLTDCKNVHIKPTCVTEQPILGAGKVRFCSNCGEKLLDDSRFCHNCGICIQRIIQTNSETTHHETDWLKSAAKQTSHNSIKTCPYCGDIIKSKAKKCEMCGKEINF